MELLLFLTAYYLFMLDLASFITFMFFIKMCVFSKLVYNLTLYNNDNNLIYDYISSFYLGILCLKSYSINSLKQFTLTNNLLIRYEYLNYNFKDFLIKIFHKICYLVFYLIQTIVLYNIPKNNFNNINNNNNDNVYYNLENDHYINMFLNDLSHLNMAIG
jgi:hypothetical protein